jgi:hypothetical protein
MNLHSASIMTKDKFLTTVYFLPRLFGIYRRRPCLNTWALLGQDRPA